MQSTWQVRTQIEKRPFYPGLESHVLKPKALQFSGSPGRSTEWCKCHVENTRGRQREEVIMNWDGMPTPFTRRITWASWGASET